MARIVEGPSLSRLRDIAQSEPWYSIKLWLEANVSREDYEVHLHTFLHALDQEWLEDLRSERFPYRVTILNDTSYDFNRKEDAAMFKLLFFEEGS